MTLFDYLEMGVDVIVANAVYVPPALAAILLGAAALVPVARRELRREREARARKLRRAASRERRIERWRSAGMSPAQIDAALDKFDRLSSALDRTAQR